jgi:hypothetical protein
MDRMQIAHIADSPWPSLGLAVLIVLGYELRLVVVERRRPAATARSAHALLRCEWVVALSRQPGCELLAVQTLRNALMSATISASTAAIALVGTLGLRSPALARGVSQLGSEALSARMVLEILLLATLFSSHVCCALAMRYFNHAGFVMSLPVGSEARLAHEAMAVEYVRRAGFLYSWGLRAFLFVAPLVAGIVHIGAMPVAALLLLFVLSAFDRVPRR